MKPYILFSLCLIIFSSCSFKKNYDSDLEEPDIDSAGLMHGYTYTALGCLVSHPWIYSGHYIDSTLNSKFYGGSKLELSNVEQELVFELQKNGGIKYWFKTDYLEHYYDTLVQNNVSKEKLKQKSIGTKYFTSGNWKANFKDSTITFDFGKNEFNLLPINGKYYELDAMNMCIGNTKDIIINKNNNEIKAIEKVQFCFEITGDFGNTKK